MYPADRLAKLGDEAARVGSALSLNDRIGLIQDVVTLARSGHDRTSSALTLMLKLEHESEALVLDEVATNLDVIGDILWEAPTDLQEGIKAVQRRLFRPIAEKLGLFNEPNDSADTIKLRTLACSTCAKAGDPKYVGSLQSSDVHFSERGHKYAGRVQASL